MPNKDEVITVVCQGCLNRMYFSVSLEKGEPRVIMPPCPVCGYKENLTIFGEFKKIDRILKRLIDLLKHEIEQEGIEAKMEITVSLDENNKTGISATTQKYYGR